MQPKSSTGLQPQASVQTPQPVAAPASGVPVAPSLQQSRFHWSHALLATGVLAASGAGTAVLLKVLIHLFTHLIVYWDVNMFDANHCFKYWLAHTLPGQYWQLV